MLLGLEPKDYDIATAARPPQVKRTFPRNSRIIGRRFKLAHLHFNNNTKILEVSTFRRTPQAESTDDDLLITRDNEFGTAEEDALRRDFTVNALFLDPTNDRILDYANGLDDVRARIIRTIGDPRVRFREDPVRILRAAKFAGRLGFSVEAETLAAMAEAAPDLTRAAAPRLLEEILRLLRGGHALDSFQLLRDVGALKSLLPVVAAFLGEAPQPQRVGFWRLLEALDHRVHEGHVPSNPVLLGTLFASAVTARAELQPTRSPSSVAEEMLGPLSMTLRLPRRDAGCLKRVCGVQHRFLQNDEEKRFKVLGFVHGPYFAEALELFELRAAAAGLDPQIIASWHDVVSRAGRHAPVSTEDFDGDENGDAIVGSNDENADRDAESTGGGDADRGDAGRSDAGRGESGRRERGRGPRRERQHDRRPNLQALPPIAADRPHEDGPGDDDIGMPLAGEGQRDEAQPRASQPRDSQPREMAPQSADRGGATGSDATGNDANDTLQGDEPQGDRGPDDLPDDGQRRRRRRRRRGRRGRGGDREQDQGSAHPETGQPQLQGAPRDGDRPLQDSLDDQPLPENSDQPVRAIPAGAGPDADGLDAEADDGSPESNTLPTDGAADADDAGAEANDGDDRVGAAGADVAATGGSDAGASDSADGAPGEPGRRRRRRRRRGRRGRGGEGGEFPRQGNQQGGDSGAPFDGDDAGPGGDGSVADGSSGDGHGALTADGDSSQADVAPGDANVGDLADGGANPDAQRQGGRQPQHAQRQQHQHQDQHGQRNRRGRRRGGQGQQQQGQQQQGQQQHGQRQQQHQQGQHGQAHQQQAHHQQGHHQQHGQQQQHGQRQQDDDRGDRRGRRNRRGGNRRDRDGRGGGRDVDVVPRHIDRRGKVDVIEPPPLDLSAFDVELDPRRVPTFGSIVEGKGRPKKKGPRVPDDDEYRPPPPPGGIGGPDAPPPPPPSSEPDDTFGDW